MRKIQVLPLLLLALVLSLLSCKKESIAGKSAPAQEDIIAVQLAANQPYTLNLPDAGSISISRQGAHFSISETGTNEETGIPSYKYIPATDFVGTDEISLLTTRIITNYSSASAGACGSGNTDSKTTSTSFISLKITVTK